MGSSFSRASCCGGGRGFDADQDPIRSSDLAAWAEAIVGLEESRNQSDLVRTAKEGHSTKPPSHNKDEEIQRKIKAIVSRGKQRMQPASNCSDDELQDRINKVLQTRAERQVQSPMPSVSRDELQEQIKVIVQAHAKSSKQERFPGTESPELASPSPAKSVSDAEFTPSRNELQDQINVIVQAHAQSLEQQRLAAITSPDLARPSPVKSVSDAEIAPSYNELQDQVNVIVQRLSGAAIPERASPSPAKSVSDAEFAHIAHLALAGAKERNTPAPATSPSLAYMNDAAHGDEFVPRKLTFEDCDGMSSDKTLVEPLKIQTSRVNLIRIPSPTRNSTKRIGNRSDEHQESALGNGVGEVTSETVANNETERTQRLHKDQLNEFQIRMKHVIEEEQKKNKERQEIEEREQMARMDTMCVNAFLECVKKCAWRVPVRTPIKGTNLYIKHMRPCRAAGTSVDVKDSNFKTLGNFLQFLEAEGLLRLQQGLTDPVVTEIRFKACRDYEYVPRT